MSDKMEALQTLDLAAHIARTALNARLQKVGMSAAYYDVLRILNEEKEVTPSHISDVLHRKRHDITTLIDRMERDKMVNTTPHPHDKRSVLIKMTVPGKMAFERAEIVVREFLGEITAKIPDKRLSKLTDTLKKLTASIDYKV